MAYRFARGVLFSSIGGEYDDHWEHPHDRTVLMYNGQKSGRYDHLIVEGVWVACRQKGSNPFTIVGKVTRVERVRAHTGRIPSLFRLTINIEDAKGTITRRDGDYYFHSEVHRVLGGWIPHHSDRAVLPRPRGIY